jgi:hypothetical protein
VNCDFETFPASFPKFCQISATEHFFCGGVLNELEACPYVFILNTATQTMTRMKDLIHPRMAHSITYIESVEHSKDNEHIHSNPKRKRFIYLMGGRMVRNDNAAIHDEVYKYDLDNDSWTQL